MILNGSTEWYILHHYYEEIATSLLEAWILVQIQTAKTS